jgi:integrase
MHTTKKALTPKEIASLFDDGLYVLGGVPGLCLRIRNGSKYFVFRYTKPSGSRSMVTIGAFPPMSVPDARKMALELYMKILDGIDPAEERRVKTQTEKAKEEERKNQLRAEQRTFSYCCDEFIKARSLSGYWINNPRGEQVARGYLRNHIAPVIGDIPIADLTADDVFRVLKPLWQTTTDTGTNCKALIYRTCQYAMAKGWREAANPASKSGKLGILLEPLSRNRKRRQNFAALPWEQIPDFFLELYKMNTTASKALAFGILTVLRAKMIYTARWENVDWKNRTMLVPESALKTKGRGDHTVYLSSTAIELLKTIPKSNYSGWIFRTSWTNVNRHITTESLEHVIKRLHERSVKRGGKGWIDPVLTRKTGKTAVITPHGTCRAAFKTWTKAGAKGLNLDEDAVEFCLAHKLKDDYNGAYNRATLEPERRYVMEEWGKYCCSKLPFSAFQNIPPNASQIRLNAPLIQELKDLDLLAG